MTDNLNKYNTKQIKEINILEITRKIWDGRRTLFVSVPVFFIIGLLYIIFTPKEYKSQSTVLIESNTNGSLMSGLIQQFTGLQGVNLNNKEQEALMPELYPDVIISSSFLLELLKQKVVESKYDSVISIAEYINRFTSNDYIKEYTLGLPGKIKKLFKSKRNNNTEDKSFFIADTNSAPVFISEDNFDNINELLDRISFNNDIKKNNRITISVEMQDPFVAAQINYLIVKKLEEYVIEYRTRKSKKDLAFITTCYEEAKHNYIDAQDELASYRDRNKNVILESVLNEEDRLEAEYNLAFDLYTSVSQQLEQAKIKVQENTPVVIVMDPAIVPLEKSKPKTILYLFIAILLGFIIGVAVIFGKQYYMEFKDKFKSNINA